MNDTVPLYGISRIDRNADRHGWWVRLKYVNTKAQIQKYFADLKYGGIVQSFAAAIAFRDKQIIINDITPKETLSWKNRLPKTMRAIQKQHGRKIVKVGTGREAAKKAYCLGMSRITCSKIRRGLQDFVLVGNGGWRTPDYEYATLKHQITHDRYKELRELVNDSAKDFSEVEKSEMVGDIMIKISTGMIDETRSLKNLICKWVALRRVKKQHPHRTMLPLDISGNIMRQNSEM